nr:hypothetical protein [Candidatus Sigynarchaeota archaeon]
PGSDWTGHLMRASGALFYAGSYLVIYGVFSSQVKTPHGRLVIYAFLYGAMIQVYILPEWNHAIYDAVTAMWYTDPANYVVFGALMVLTSVPIIDLFVLAIRRLKASFLNRRSRLSVQVLAAGILLPFVGSIVPYCLPLGNLPAILLSNVMLTACLVIFGLSIAVDPLVLNFSKAMLGEIVMTRTEQGDIPIAMYSWISSRDAAMLSSQLLSAVAKTLESQFGPGENRGNLQQLHLDQMDVLIEKTAKFTAYLVASNVDEICRVGLRRLASTFEQKYGPRTGINAFKTVKDDEFFAEISRVFTFVSGGAPGSMHAGLLAPAGSENGENA